MRIVNGLGNNISIRKVFLFYHLPAYGIFVFGLDLWFAFQNYSSVLILKFSLFLLIPFLFTSLLNLNMSKMINVDFGEDGNLEIFIKDKHKLKRDIHKIQLFIHSFENTLIVRRFKFDVLGLFDYKFQFLKDDEIQQIKSYTFERNMNLELVTRKDIILKTFLVLIMFTVFNFLVAFILNKPLFIKNYLFLIYVYTLIALSSLHIRKCLIYKWSGWKDSNPRPF